MKRDRPTAKTYQKPHSPKTSFGSLKKVNKSEIAQAVGRLSIDELRSTLLASELSRRDGWKSFYEEQKKNKTLESQLDIERKRAVNVCPICSEVMTNQQTNQHQTSTEFCGHSFHKACLEAYKQGAFGEAPQEGCPLNCK